MGAIPLSLGVHRRRSGLAPAWRRWLRARARLLSQTLFSKEEIVQLLPHATGGFDGLFLCFANWQVRNKWQACPGSHQQQEEESGHSDADGDTAVQESGACACAAKGGQELGTSAGTGGGTKGTPEPTHAPHRFRESKCHSKIFL